ncbi:MAG: Ig-like domain-containing protein [Candidatus Eisenbacteria bacterium]|nr:Ig-like domain-containing protein [Candidatus Eisenbacteria bacterium]
MIRFVTVVSVLALFAASLPALAAGPGEQPPATDTSPRALTRSGFAGVSETTITGLVVDQSGKPLMDVAVKLYMGGLLADEQVTSSDGSYEFSELIDYGKDVTIDLWFVPPTDELVMENVILKESTAARQYELYSDCVQRVRLDPITDVIVKLYSLEERIEMLKRKGCIG